MDPNYLSLDELKYELSLRGIVNVSTRRRMVSALEEWLRREKIGLATRPTTSNMFNSLDEIQVCFASLHDINEQIKNAPRPLDQSLIQSVSHRLIHIEQRVNRILPASPSEVEDLVNILNRAKDIQKEMDSRYSLPVASPQHVVTQVENRTTPPSEVVNVATVSSDRNVSNGFNSLSRGAYSHKSSTQHLNENISHPDNQISNLNGTHIHDHTVHNVEARFSNGLIPAAVGRTQQLLSPYFNNDAQFQPIESARLRDSIGAESRLLLDERAALTDEIEHELNIQAPTFRPSLGQRQRINNSPVYESRSPLLNRPRMSTFQNVTTSQVPDNQIEVQRLDNFPNPAQTNNIVKPNRLTNNLSHECEPRAFRQEDPNRYAPGGEIRLRTNDRDYGRESEFRCERDRFDYSRPNLQQPQRDHLRDDIEYRFRYENNFRRNERLENVDCRENVVNLNYDPRVPRNVDYPERPNNAYPMENRRRKNVPVNQWKITFSGDGYGLHLYDFLSQVEIYKRSEQISNAEIMYSIIFLLSGRARLWYQSTYRSFRSWEELVDGLKREFLPANYDFVLFAEILNRVQKNNESFAEYITHMQALFNCLAIPLSEQHKMFIVQKNLLPRYAVGVAPLDLRSLRELSDVCRRIDNASASNNKHMFNLPFQQPFHRSDRYPNRTQNIHVIDEPELENDIANPCEIYALQKNQSRNPVTSKTSSASTKCWNCDRQGHIFRDCGQPRTAMFCFYCGARDVTVKNCKCAENKNDTTHRNTNQEASALGGPSSSYTGNHRQDSRKGNDVDPANPRS